MRLAGSALLLYFRGTVEKYFTELRIESGKYEINHSQNLNYWYLSLAAVPRGLNGGNGPSELFLLKGTRIAGFPCGAAHVDETPK
jgi:hypothetical protein